jgi:hypothetical protein
MVLDFRRYCSGKALLEDAIYSELGYEFEYYSMLINILNQFNSNLPKLSLIDDLQISKINNYNSIKDLCKDCSSHRIFPNSIQEQNFGKNIHYCVFKK